MGSGASCIGQRECIEVVHWDGRTTIYEKCVRAGEVAKEHPEHWVCEWDSFYMGQKIPAVSPLEELKRGHRYLLVPVRSFGSAFVLSLGSLVGVGRASLQLSQPFAFDILNTTAGGGRLQIKIRGEFISKLIQHQHQHAQSGSGRLCNTPELHKDYARLVTSRNQIWRPKLDTIPERDPIPAKICRRFNISAATGSLRSLNRRKSSMLQ